MHTLWSAGKRGHSLSLGQESLNGKSGSSGSAFLTSCGFLEVFLFPGR